MFICKNSLLQIQRPDQLFDDFLVAILVILIIGGYFFLKPRKGYTPVVSFYFPFLKRRIVEILKKNFPFYSRLSRKEKKKFLRRVAYFISIKNFLPMDIKKVTKEMKVLISACAIELTYGLPEIYLSHFKDIQIYSGQNPVDDDVLFDAHENNSRIILIWNYFQQAYLKRTDEYNYGVHEIAKALHIENRIKNDEFCFMKEQDLDEWNEAAGRVLSNPALRQSELFSSFEGDLEKEFFSVVIESFIERPVQLHDQFPELYRKTSKILNQNPLRLYEAQATTT